MKPANYSVVRYIPDPGRNEELNVGIVLWNDRDFGLRIDELAVDRVIRENPWLATNALLHLESSLQEKLSHRGSFNQKEFQKALEDFSSFPVLLTEPRHTTIQEDQPNALSTTLDRLIQRVVRPNRRGGGGGSSPVENLARFLRPLLQRRAISRNHVFRESRTGIPRRVDFFANSKANVGLDALRLNLKSADQILERTDAEAFKIEDITSKNKVGFFVYCDFSQAEKLRRVNQNTRKVLESVGAIVTGDIQEAVRKIEKATKRS
jgi:hypothetical protein